jgi:hypothetical protein
MNSRRGIGAVLLLALVFATPITKAISVKDVGDIFDLDITGMLKPESVFANNANYINGDELDRTIKIQNTFDLGLRAVPKAGGVEFYMGARNRLAAGDPTAASSTSQVATKVVDAFQAPHSHASGKNFLWVRELWMRWDIGKVFNIPTDSNQTITIGIFPFQVGRGISLGDVYAAGPELLGFYSETYVDQYAFGLLFSGDVWSDWVTYALYFGLLKNKSGNVKEVNEKIYASRYEYQDRPQRGFGDINYVIANYFNIYAYRDDVYGSVRLQPYWVFNQDNGQVIEFPNDAQSVLGTIGLEGEYLSKYFEFGFEMAFNAGKQIRFGWDRNIIKLIDNAGNIAEVNSHVVTALSDGQNVPFVSAKDPAQKAIYAVPQTECSNSQQIPGDFTQIGYLDNPSGMIFNAKDRFSDPYDTILKGWMLLADASFWIMPGDLRLSLTAGAASGGVNPHHNTEDGNYDGFVPLQEAYSGKRVKFAFPTSKIQRPVGNPIYEDSDNKLTKTTSGFTNIVFMGAGVAWTPSDWENAFKLNPNIIAYWNEKSVPLLVPFDNTSEGCLPQASNFLGVELNLYLDYNVVKNLKLFVVTSFFIPGTFFSDIEGRRAAFDLDQEQGDDATGFAADTIPKYGHSTAYTLNIGAEYRF